MGRWTESQIGQALAAADRHELGLNAPPQGLYFVAAKYPEDNNINQERNS
jgi:tRNA pseudouridine38-40 synthase